MSSGGKPTGIGGGGLSPEDINLIQTSLGQNVGMMDARYQQLGLGTPSSSVAGGDPATAAASGQNLQWGGRSTANIMDDKGLAQQAGAALGTLQNENQTNPAIAGSAANIQQTNSSLANLISQAGFNAGAQSQSG